MDPFKNSDRFNCPWIPTSSFQISDRFRGPWSPAFLLKIRTDSSVRGSLHPLFKFRTDSAVRGALHPLLKFRTDSAVRRSLHMLPLTSYQNYHEKFPLCGQFPKYGHFFPKCGTDLIFSWKKICSVLWKIFPKCGEKVSIISFR